MSLYRRGETWWINVTSPDGRRIRRSTGTDNRQKAQQYHDQLKAENWRVHKLREKPRRTWKEAVVRYLKEMAHKASIREDKWHFRWLDEHFAGLYLDQITRDRIDLVTQIRLAEEVSHARCNRLLAAIRALLRKAAHEWEWIGTAPKIRMLVEPKHRIRWLTREQAEKLLFELPDHLKEMVRFALSTGLRKKNVTHLTWSQIDLDRRVAWIHADQAKARKAFGIPLNEEAMEVLLRQKGKHPVYVFCYRGRAPIQCVNGKPWRNALKRAGIENFRWHDLRHTWASWHAQEGTPQHVLQELGAWESVEMVRRYAHLAPEHLKQYAEKLGKLRDLDDCVTNLAQ